MYCQHCGKQIGTNAVFCPHCGKQVAAINNQTERFSLRCSQCGGTMTMSENGKFLKCPYCKNEEALFDSEAVKIEAIRSALIKDIEIERLRKERAVETERVRAEEDNKDFRREMDKYYSRKRWHRVKTVLIGLLVMLAGLGLLIIAVSLQRTSNSLAMFLFLAGVATFIVGIAIMKSTSSS